MSEQITTALTSQDWAEDHFGPADVIDYQMWWNFAIDPQTLRERRRKIRRNFCGAQHPGKYYQLVGLAVGSLKNIVFVCHDYRGGCPYCNTKKAKDQVELVQRGLDRYGVLYSATVAKARWDAIKQYCKRHKVAWKRYPLGETFFVILSADVDGLDTKVLLTPAVIDFKALLVKIPLDSRISGSLGDVGRERKRGGLKLPKPITIEVEYIAHDAPTWVQEGAFEKAVERTAYLNPHLPEEVQEASIERTFFYKQFLGEEGFPVLSSFHGKRVVPFASCLLWGKTQTVHTSTDLTVPEVSAAPPETFEEMDCIPQTWQMALV